MRSLATDCLAIQDITQDINLLQEELNSAFRSTSRSYNIGRKLADSDTSSKIFFKKVSIPGSTAMLYYV